MHIKHIHEMIEDLAEYGKCVVEEATTSNDKVDVHLVGEIVDMIKDLACAEKDSLISKSMKEAEEEEEEQEKYVMRRLKEEYGEDEEKVRRGYDTWRYADGRYAPKGRGHYVGKRGYMPLDMMRPWDETDMDAYGVSDADKRNIDRKMGRNVHYYDDGMMMHEDGKYSKAKRGYEEAKSDKSMDAQHKAKKIGEWYDAFAEDVMEMLKDATPEEKTMLKNKLVMTSQKI